MRCRPHRRLASEPARSPFAGTLPPSGLHRAGRIEVHHQKSPEATLGGVVSGGIRITIKFRGRFLFLARKAVPTVQLPDLQRKGKWNVFCKPSVQGPEGVFEYLGRYVQKTALSNRAIVECTDRTVTFRYRDSKDQRVRKMTLPPGEFLRRFLQYVQPRGFHRVRSYGLMHSSQRVTLRRLQLMLQPKLQVDSALEQARVHRRPRCPTCKSERLRVVRRITVADRHPTAVKPNELRQLARAPPP